MQGSWGRGYIWRLLPADGYVAATSTAFCVKLNTTTRHQWEGGNAGVCLSLSCDYLDLRCMAIVFSLLQYHVMSQQYQQPIVLSLILPLGISGKGEMWGCACHVITLTLDVWQ